jgi:hypothetical protein
MTPHRKWFNESIPLIKTHATYMGDRRIQQAIGVGTIIIHLYSSHEINVQNVQNVLDVPRINKNLLSIGQTTALGLQMLIKDDTCWISTKNSQGIFFKSKLKGKESLSCGSKDYNGTKSCSCAHSFFSEEEFTMLSFQRFGHLGI